MALPAAQKAVVSAVGAREIGQASGAFNTMRQVGGVFGIAVIVAVFAGTGSYASPRQFTDGFASAIGTAAVLAAVGALIAVGVPGRRPLGSDEPGHAHRPVASLTHRTTDRLMTEGGS
jgi:hypothetical protein